MAANWPTSYDDFTVWTDVEDEGEAAPDIDADEMNKFSNVGYALEHFIGLGIQGAYDTLADRLAATLGLGAYDLDGGKLTLDGDGDTSIQADTDDQIDVEIAGADDFQFTANTFTVLAGSIIVMNGNLDLNGQDILLDADADTYLHESADDVIDLVLAGASGELAININGAEDFVFTANTLTAVAGSAIKTDTINETTGAAGVTIDGCLIKDGDVDGVDVSDYLTGEFFLTAAGGWPSTTSGCAAVAQVEYGTNDVDLMHADFDKDTDEFMQWTTAMPFNWNGGTVTAKFYWLANDATTNAVVWGLQGRSYGDGEAVDQAWGTAQTVTDANGGTANQVRISAATAAITLAGTPAAGELVQFRAYRDADNGDDTLAVDARLIGVLVTYTRA